MYICIQPLILLKNIVVTESVQITFIILHSWCDSFFLWNSSEFGWVTYSPLGDNIALLISRTTCLAFSHKLNKVFFLAAITISTFRLFYLGHIKEKLIPWEAILKSWTTLSYSNTSRISTFCHFSIKPNSKPNKGVLASSVFP